MPKTVLNFNDKVLAVFSLVMLVAMVALDLAIPRLVQHVIDFGIKQNSMLVVLQTSALMLGISLLDTIVAVLNSNSSVRVGESVARDLREAIFVKVQGFSPCPGVALRARIVGLRGRSAPYASV